MLKPLGLSGSRGVIRANDQQEFDAAFERIRALLARPQVRAARTGLEDEILVEEYIDGREYALEGVLTDGALRVFALFDKPDPLEGPFFEETIYVTPSRLPAAAQARIVDHVQRASHALGLWHGPIHAECRITRDGAVYVLEVAARPIGGLCSRVLTFRGAICLAEARPGFCARRRVARGGAAAACRRAVDRARHARARGRGRDDDPDPSRGMYKGVSGEDEARAVPGVTDVRITAKVGQLLETLPEAGSYLGFISCAKAAPLATRKRRSRRTPYRATEVRTFDSSRLPVSS